MSNTIDNLLKSVSEITARYRKIFEDEGADFNIFKIIGLTSEEVRVHSAFIANMLNPKGSHHQGDGFLRLFVKELGLSQNFDTQSAVVQCEKYIAHKTETTGGRIDIFIEDKQGHKIIIENKIYATDQTNQILRYHNYAKEATILYLTLYGNEPNDKSFGNAKDKVKYSCISYANDITKWLEQCYNTMNKKPILAEGIHHYIDLIKYLTNQSTDIDMTNKITETITADSANLQVALKIQQALPFAKAIIQKRFWKKMFKSFEAKGYNPKYYFCDEPTDDLTRYIENFATTNAAGDGIKKKNKWYGIEIEIAQCDDYTIKWRVEVDNNIFYGFKIRGNGELIKPDHKDKVFDYLYDALCKDKNADWQDSDAWLVWNYPSGARINFREFNHPDILSLADNNDSLITHIINESQIHIEKMKHICEEYKNNHNLPNNQ